MCPSMRLTTNKSPSQGNSDSSSLWLLEEVGELDLEAWELWSLATTPTFTIMLLLEGQFVAMCPKPRYLKHFVFEVLVGDLGVEMEGLETL